MPHATTLQESFSGGEFSPKIFARVSNERYKTGLARGLNYIPLLQGPLVRRPGNKYVGNDAKDPSKPPAFYEFKFNATQNYVLEIGDLYMRFYTNNGQIVTNSTNFQVSGKVGTVNVTFASANFYAMRSSPNPGVMEAILATSVVASGSVLEIGTPWTYQDAQNLKTVQKDDTLYFTASSYPQYKLQRLGGQAWDLKPVLHQDGPYLPLNSYRSTGDSARVELRVGPPDIIYQDGSMDFGGTTGPVFHASSIISGTGSRIRIITTAQHGYFTGDRVVIKSMGGTVEANNGTSTIASMFWNIIKVDDTTFELANSVFTNAYTGSSGSIYPALFEPYQVSTVGNDIGRTIALYRLDGGRAWGRIFKFTEMHAFYFHVDAGSSPQVTGSSANIVVELWQLGVWNRSNGYPTACTMHQDRMVLGGTPAYPQRLDLSMTGLYENFQASGSSNIVSANNACSYNLNSDQLNRINWLKSDQQGLLAGSLDSEWTIAPNNQATALTPTNVNAAQTSFFGSADSDAVRAGNGTLYIQRGGKRVRELNYFFQVNTFRSTDVAELSDHLLNPPITKLSVQKESVPIVWALRSDGQLLSMTYSRDDQVLKAGWTPHQLGGRSDSGDSAPIIKSMAVIPSPDGTFDQLWVAVQRFINGTSVLNVEYMTKIFDEKTAIEDAYQFDCGATYNSPITITGLTNGSAVVTAAAHGFLNGNLVKINAVTGLNSSFVDVNGVIFNSNFVNGRVFQANSVSINAFYLTDADSGTFLDARSYSVYVSGGEARKLVTQISGLTWLKNETVGVLADGGIHPISTINSAGVLTLSYPAAKVQIGYPYNSDGRTLRPEAGSADGTSIGKMRRAAKIALMLNNVGEISIGPSFDRLTPLEFNNADSGSADTATPLFSGMVQESVESEYNYDGQVSWRQNSGLPGMIQSISVMIEENDA